MNMKRFLGLALAGALSLSLLAGCGGNDDKTPDANAGDAAASANGDSAAQDNSLQYIKDNGKFVLGLDDSFPPMGFKDETGAIVGFDIDLATAVCEKLGVELVVQPIDWNSKEMELSTKNIDCIWNGMSVTDERKESLNLSVPYMENHMALVVKPDSGISGIADMQGKSLSLQAGSSAADALDSEDGAELKGAVSTVNEFDTNLNALLDLETGASDAVLMDDVVAEYLIGQSGKNLVVLNDFLYAEDYAIGFRKGDDALTEAVNEALRALNDEGKVKEIAEKWSVDGKIAIS